MYDTIQITRIPLKIFKKNCIVRVRNFTDYGLLSQASGFTDFLI